MAKNPTTPTGNECIDTARFFHGDSPAREVEAGQQKGGHYFCSNCGCHAERVDELDHVLNCPIISFQDRMDTVMKPGTVSRANSVKQKLKPLSNLSKKQLEKELGARGIYDGKTKQELQAKLDMELHGIQRVPALLVHTPDIPLKHLHLANYEILPTEPLRDIGHHIENVLTELPHHLEVKERHVFEDCVSTCLDGKDSKRVVDYRAGLLKIIAYSQQNRSLSETPLLILETLSEMQRILYCVEEKRNPCLILRYYNQSWYHAIPLKLFLKHPKKLTTRKLFGVYFHDLTAHAGCMLRLVSGQAANAEEEERIFHHIKLITKRTSNYSNDQVIPNIMVRLQAEKQMTRREDATKQDAHISTLSNALNPQHNTRIRISTIKMFEREWQAHLQEISDFLLEGKVFGGTQIMTKLNFMMSPVFPNRVDQPDGRVKKVHTLFLGSDLTHNREKAARSSTYSPVRSTTPSKFQDKEKPSQPKQIIVEETENVIDMELAAGEALELGDTQGTEKSVAPCTSFLGQVSTTKNTNGTRKENHEVLQSSLCKALAHVWVHQKRYRGSINYIGD